MAYVYQFAGLAAGVILLSYVSGFNWGRFFKNNPYVSLALIGFAAHLLAMKIDMPYDYDLNCFKSWSIMLYEDGLANFYNSNNFTDYPPGYMYVLFLIGGIQKFFTLDYYGGAFTALVKAPAILCDIAATLIIYGMASAKRDDSESPGFGDKAFLIAAAYALNPAILVDSAVWGQVDSIYTLAVFAAVYLASENKFLPAFLTFAAAVTIKPQALTFSPIFLFLAFKMLEDANFKPKAFLRLGKYFFCCLLLWLFFALPFTSGFNFSPVFEQYKNTITSYPYATLNAYNFYAFIGANWADVTTKVLGLSYTTWGIIFIDGIVFLSILLLYRNGSKANFFFVAGLINLLTFMFSIRMHERYLFPTLLFFLAAFVCRPDKKLLALYGGFSVTALVNCADVLHMLSMDSPNNFLNDYYQLFSLTNLELTAISIYAAFTVFKPLFTENDAEPDSPADAPSFEDESHVNDRFDYNGVQPYSIFPKMGRLDYILLGGLILVYTVIAFINLGDMKSPQTTWEGIEGRPVNIDLGEIHDLTRMQYMLGPRTDQQFRLSSSVDGSRWTDQTVECKGVFSWSEVELNLSARYLRIVPESDELMIRELAFRTGDRLVEVDAAGVDKEARYLLDEQELVPDKKTFMNSTYFDEIYHARTAYEFIHQMKVYEWTHPPLGKVIIAAGIQLFGMTPFGWRFSGTVTGILMIPLIYIFAKKMFGDDKTYWAFFATLIFTFDFMHFAQTRIATIDSYVTLFIIGMYYFMFVYYQGDFYGGPLKKSLPPLALSGLFMGLAVASKWPGLYAAAGLAVIFFISVYKGFSSPRYPLRYAAVTLGCCCIFFVAIPAVTYLLSYIPYLKCPGMDGLKGILDNQKDIFSYHANLVSEHPYSSTWWQWRINYKPIFYYSGVVVVDAANNIRSGISSFGNPALWWGGIVAMYYCMERCANKTSKTAGFLLIAYAAQLLPWVLVPRTTYIYHYFPCVPFLALMVTLFFKDFIAPRHKKITPVFGVTVVLLFALFYPVLSGAPVGVDFVRHFLKWLPSWALI